MTMETDAHVQICRLIGEAILAWNTADAAIRTLLAAICGSDNDNQKMRSAALVAELGSVSLAHCISSIADAVFPEPVKGATIHAVRHFERTLAYRNYYVHGITMAAATEKGAVGRIGIVSAKGKLKAHVEDISAQDIEALIAHSKALAAYTASLRDWMLSDESTSDTQGAGLPPRPPLPDKLEKAHQHLAELFQRRSKASDQAPS